MPKIKNSFIEKQRLKYLTNNPIQIINKFLEYGIILKSLTEKGGRGHHDLEFEDINGNKSNIEHKGFRGNTNLNIGAPWKSWSPQYLNDGMKYEIDELFANKWHTDVIPQLKEHFDINCDIPSYDDWKRLDANQQGSCGSEFSNLLKEKYYEKDKNKDHIKNLVHKTLRDIYDNLTPENFRTFECKLLERSNIALEDKQWWMGIRYATSDSIEPLEISLVKGPTITNLKVVRVETKRVGPVLVTEYSTSITPNIIYEGEARLRFRNTTGIANIGWGIK